jgi:hypothetical protein
MGAAGERQSLPAGFQHSAKDCRPAFRLATFLRLEANQLFDK